MQEKLAIIDWGIGGIGIYKEIKKLSRRLPVIYFSDTGVTPYGKMSRRVLTARLSSAISYLQTRGATHVLVGCNAASTAIPFLDRTEIPVEGMIETAVQATIKLRPSRLGLIGGRRTVLSGSYRTALATRGIDVRQRVAQPLSGMIESGDVSSAVLRNECRRILTPLKDCSHILLACTHYPAIIPMMKNFVSAKTIFIDPATDLAKKVGRWKLNGRGEDIFLTSGDGAAMKRSALTAFGVTVPRAQRVYI